tara:strand:- start:492 stop:1430 length:939 start_codon:yes stop_codon:yes gene_type:complete
LKIHKNKFKGVVVSSKANYLNVDIDIDDYPNALALVENMKVLRLLCKPRSKLKYIGHSIYPGDKVLVEEVDWKLRNGVICNIQDRNSLIKRPPVANVTNVVVLLSVSQPKLALDQASRFLITAEKVGMEVTLVLTKIDLISSDKLIQLIKQLQDWCYSPIPISLKQGKGIEVLLRKLKSTYLSVLCGPSGVGKSSLINYMLPDQSISTAPVSTKLKRGRHTTRNVELFYLSNGSLVADTPGFNRPDLEIEPDKIQFLFPEIRSQLTNDFCKFRDCLHKDEPGCLVNKDWKRYSFYREYLEEMLILRQSFQGD